LLAAIASQDGEAAADAEKPAAAEEPKELEVDAPKCTKQKMKGAVEILVQDTTLNAMLCDSNRTLMSLAEGGMQHLLAGVRGSVGVTKGRYMFEVKILELANAAESVKGVPKHTLKVGFSTSASNLFAGDTAESICFESNGSLVHNKSRTKACASLASHHGTVLAVVLNLDPASPNANTLSLFKDGVRMCQPQALPDCLKGKPLFPAVTYKSITAHVNFGPETLTPLPFKCRMLQDAAQADVVAAKSEVPADGKYEVVFPVGMPDEGTFDRLDDFLKKNPKYAEISDRMISEWIEKSGVWRQRGHSAKSKDKPERGFGVRELDDDSIRRAIMAVAPMQPRHYVVMEVKGNLLEENRKSLLAQWKDPMFKKIADVVVGKPPAEFKKQVQQAVLKAKQEKAEKAWEARKAEKVRQRLMAKKKKEAEKAKAKALKLAKRKAEEAKKKMEEAKKKAEEAKKKKEEGEKEGEKEEEAEKKEDEEMKAEEEKKEDEDEEEDEAEEEEPEEPEEPAPKEELTAEEKALTFRPSEVPDLAPLVLSSTFTKFSVPKKDEGFDDIRYEWDKAAQAEQYVKQWILDKKLNSRVEELKPSIWFREKVQTWQKAVAQWKQKQTECKSSLAKKQSERAAKKKAREAAASRAATKAAARAKLEEMRKEKGTEPTEKDIETEAKEKEAMEAEKKKEAEEVEKEAEEIEAEERADADFKTLDIFGAEDIDDVGGGLPLFKDFQQDDWTLMGLLFELNLLIHAFAHDVDDAERPGIHLSHLAFYYKKYYNKDLNPKDFGVEKLEDVVDLVGSRIVYLTPKEVLATQLDGEFESLGVFPKLVELARRDRRLRADLGEETAVLKFTRNAGGGGGGGGWGGQGSSYGPARGGKGGGKSGGKGGFPSLAPRFSRPYGGGGGKGGPRRW